ncbi:proton-translocating transhydrogenase family protein [Phaeospirillum tilakii]|uniref:proton-translocating NAD(P)(+) transhydrogenase n=1 Tax=Phaeospirillum tilakii TaxID=741673 RepID=A0ABW5C921_9PROT
MDSTDLVRAAAKLAQDAEQLNLKAAEMLAQAGQIQAMSDHGIGFVSLFTVFVLACFVGYYVVWRVTPALHSPLMAVTNAISSVIVVGALIATATDNTASRLFGFIAVILASINIFGGFMVTQRMLGMFKKKQK